MVFLFQISFFERDTFLPYSKGSGPRVRRKGKKGAFFFSIRDESAYISRVSNCAVVIILRATLAELFLYYIFVFQNGVTNKLFSTRSCYCDPGIFFLSFLPSRILLDNNFQLSVPHDVKIRRKVVFKMESFDAGLVFFLYRKDEFAFWKSICSS